MDLRPLGVDPRDGLNHLAPGVWVGRYRQEARIDNDLIELLSGLGELLDQRSRAGQTVLDSAGRAGIAHQQRDDHAVPLRHERKQRLQPARLQRDAVEDRFLFGHVQADLHRLRVGRVHRDRCVGVGLDQLHEPSHVLGLSALARVAAVDVEIVRPGLNLLDGGLYYVLLVTCFQGAGNRLARRVDLFADNYHPVSLRSGTAAKGRLGAWLLLACAGLIIPVGQVAARVG